MKKIRTMFSRRHYKVVAQAIADAKQASLSPAEARGIFLVQRNLVEIFAEDNHGFDRPKFLDSCGRVPKTGEAA